MMQPNILFFFPDQWRHDWTGFNPALDLRTPNLDRIARHGVRFRDVCSPSPVCAPARACLALGVNYENSPVRANKDNLPLERRTIYRAMRDEGYHVMGCGKFDLHKGDMRWGLDGQVDLDAWGFSAGIDNEGKHDAFAADREGRRGPYMAWLETRGLREAHIADHQRRGNRGAHPTPLPDDAYCDNWITRNGLELLRAAPLGKPWFLQVNFAGPHSPWDVTESMWTAMRGRTFPTPVHSEHSGNPEALEIRRNYAAMIENIDRCAGLFLQEIERRGELENTLVVFSSDHGEMLGDHNLFDKCTWRHASMNVPLMVSGPGVIPGRVVDAPTELLDLAGTFLDYARAQPPAPCDARSLRPVLDGRVAGVREWVTSGLSGAKHDWRAVMDTRWKLVVDHGKILLFDRKLDPEEIRDVSGEYPSVVEQYLRHLPQTSSNRINL